MSIVISRLPKPRRRRAGFTLIELMIIVAVVGILSTLAIYAYRHWLAQARTGQVKDLVQTIMLGEKTYYADTEGYLDCSESWTDYYPMGVKPNNTKHQFHNPSHSDYTCFKLLAPESESPTYAAFTVRAGTPNDPVPATPLSNLTGTWELPPTTPWYIVLATVDQDDDKVLGYWLGSSFEPNNIHTENEEE